MSDKDRSGGGGIDISDGRVATGRDIVGGDHITYNYYSQPTKSKSFFRPSIIAAVILAIATIIAALIGRFTGLPLPTSSVTPNGKQIIYCGYVRDMSEGKGISNAIVTIELNPPMQTNTDANGYFYFTGDPPFPNLPIRATATAGDKGKTIFITIPSCVTPTQDIIF